MKKHLTTLMLLLMVLIMVMTGCANQPAETTEPTAEPTPEATAAPTAEPTPEVMTYTDVLGRTIEVKADDKVERIVSLTAANTEILFALGLQDKIVGVDVYSNYPAETEAIEKVGDFNGPSVEAVVALEPDLILAGNKLQATIIEELSNLGLPVVAVEPTEYEKIGESIQFVGALTHSEDAAQKLVDSMKEKQDAILALPRDDEEVTSYFVMSAGDFGNWTSGPGSFINDMMISLGMKPITEIKDGAPWMDYNLEALVEADPDVLFLSSQAGVDVDGLKELTGYKDLTAIKEGRVYVLDADIISRTAPRIVDALQAMYDAVYKKAE